MREFCHRCGGELPAGDGPAPFCPHRGAPPIYLMDHEQPAETAEGGTTGAVPPPRPPQGGWETAVRCAALVALVAGVLSVVATKVPVLSPLSSLWTISGSLIAVGCISGGGRWRGWTLGLGRGSGLWWGWRW